MSDNRKSHSGSSQTSSKNNKNSSRNSNFGERIENGSLEEHTVDELQEMARDQGISGTSNMRKDELMKALQKESNGDGSSSGHSSSGGSNSKK